MLLVILVPLQAGVPDWLALAVVVASIILAILTLSFMLLRFRPVPDEDIVDTPTIVRDPVLVLSALGVIVLAAAAWLLR